MSRKGKYPIKVPQGVEVKINKNSVSVKGPKGTLESPFRKGVHINQDSEGVKISIEDPEMKKFQGLYHSLITNMIEGTTKGFEKILTMIGVGYRAAVKGHSLDLTIGLSHPTEIPIPKGLEVKVEKNTTIIITGADKHLVGLFAAEIRSRRPPEPYQGKGIRYKDEYVRRKAGKSAAKK